ncbi:holin [Anaerosporobacter sp.]|uniref:holin n=1 Tax=Anaerosporobacter sp. TaxID=1872529 RepID=UPI00286EC3F1|nr:holin [Anaerosporobacter sp.]
MNKKWLRAATVRATKTVAQTAIGTIGATAVFSAVDWKMVVSASLLAGVVSMLTSVAGLPEVESEE